VKIKVRGIPADGLEIVKSVEPEEIGLSDDDLTCLSPIEILVKAERVTNVVVAHVEVLARVAYTCSRCLEDVERESHDQFKFEYPVEKATEFIDIGEDLRQELILNLPSKVLCREDCRGICPHCGANLNDEKCDCSL